MDIKLNWEQIKGELSLIKTNTLVGKLFNEIFVSIENEIVSLEGMDKARNVIAPVVPIDNIVPVASPEVAIDTPKL